MGFEIGKVTNLYLGRVGENMARTVKIDVSEWQERWPGASIILSAIRPKEKELYMPPQDVVDGMLVWPIRAEDVAIAGRGAAQIRAVEPHTNECYMARVVETRVEASLLGGVLQETEPPENDWVTKIITEVRTAQRVHVGSDMPPAHCDVWIDPQGESDPDNYPVASEDERGCIRVGDGLQMDGDVLSVIPQKSSLPENSNPYMQLVTDNKGVTRWEERTHYDYSGGTVLPLTDLAVVGGYATFQEPFATLPQAGTPYKVTYLGFEYECTGIATEADGKPCVVIGNESHMGQGLNTREPFIFVFYNPEDVTDGIYGWFSCLATNKPTIPVSIVGNGELKKLDKKFLPDDIGGMPEGGAPFQQLVTDGEGNTVWADRLAYEDPNAMTEILPETELVDAGDDGFIYAQPLGVTLAAGETYTVTYNGATFDCTAVDATAMNPYLIGAVALGNFGAATGTGDTGEPFFAAVLPDALVSEMGVSIICMPIDGATSVTLSIAKGGGIHRIPLKFLPEYMYGVESEGTVYLAEVNVALSADKSSGFIIKPFDKPLVVGETYVVHWNGEQIECEAKDITGTGVRLDGATSSGTSFKVMQLLNPMDGGDGILVYGLIDYTGDSTPSTLAITDGKEVIRKVPEKFLPAIGGALTITADYDPSGPTVTNISHTCAQALEAFAAGRDVRLLLFNNEYGLNYSLPAIWMDTGSDGSAKMIGFQVMIAAFSQTLTANYSEQDNSMTVRIGTM